MIPSDPHAGAMHFAHYRDQHIVAGGGLDISHASGRDFSMSETATPSLGELGQISFVVSDLERAVKFLRDQVG
jgi:hypothetical protein